MIYAIIFHKSDSSIDSNERFEVGFNAKVVEPDHYEIMFRGDVYPKSGDTTEALLNILWQKTQNDFYAKGWRVGMGGVSGCRSSMIGDIFMVGQSLWVVEPIGFRELTSDEAKKFIEHMGNIQDNKMIQSA